MQDLENIIYKITVKLFGGSIGNQLHIDFDNKYFHKHHKEYIEHVTINNLKEYDDKRLNVKMRYFSRLYYLKKEGEKNV